MRWALAVLVVALAASPAAAGQRIWIKTTANRFVEGELVDTLPNGYLVRTATGVTIRVPFSEVADVKKGPAVAADAPAPAAPRGPGPGLWQLESRSETVTTEDDGAARTFSRKFLVAREDGFRDVPARELIARSGAADLRASYDKARDDVASDKTWSHLGHAAKQLFGLGAAIAGIYFLTGDYATEEDKVTYYSIGGFATLVGVSVTIDNPFRWSKSIKRVDARLRQLEDTPNLDLFMQPERARDEVERHNRALGR